MKLIRLTENDLHRMIVKSVNRILSEDNKIFQKQMFDDDGEPSENWEDKTQECKKEARKKEQAKKRREAAKERKEKKAAEMKKAEFRKDQERMPNQADLFGNKL